jgi:hypothetical protein
VGFVSFYRGEHVCILAAVEGCIAPPGIASLSEELTAKPARVSAGQDPRLYGSQDACLYAKQIPRLLKN